MKNTKNCRTMLLAGAALMVSIIMFTGPVFAQDIDLGGVTQIAFGNVNVGQEVSADLTITVSNTNYQWNATVSLSSACSGLSLGTTSLPSTVPGGTGVVTVYFTPNQAGPCEGTMTLQFYEVQPFGPSSIGTAIVAVNGTGLAPEEPPEPPPVDMGSILEFFDTSVYVKNPGDKGRKHAANERLKELRRMLVKADTWIQKGEEEKACRILKVVRKKIDRKHKPGSYWDDDKGEVLTQLDDMISQVMADLSCPSGRIKKKNKHK